MKQRNGEDEMANFFQIFLNNLHLVSVLALTTLGLALTYKTANTTNFAQSILSTAGAFTAAYIVTKFPVNGWVATIGGVLACFLVGVFIDAVIIRRASAGASSRVMITLGLIILFSASIPLIFGMIPYEFVRFFSGNFSFGLLGVNFTITKNAVFIFCASVVVIAVVFMALYLTKWGLGVRATASNMSVASMMGINTNRITAVSWGVSSACGALAAIFYSSQTTNVSVDMLATVQSSSLLAFVLGGYTSFYWPVVGAVIIPIATILLSMISGLWANALLYILVLLTILVRPMGLFGKETIKKV